MWSKNKSTKDSVTRMFDKVASWKHNRVISGKVIATSDQNYMMRSYDMINLTLNLPFNLVW